MRVLSDPVTVTEEFLFDIPLYNSMRRGKEAIMLKSGNLLCMARLNFRVKCNNQLGDIRNLGALSADWKQAFFLWNSPVRMNYTIMFVVAATDI